MSLIGHDEWLQWGAGVWQTKSDGLLQAPQQTMCWAAAWRYIPTDVHPPSLSLSPSHQCVRMCSCWSITVRDEARTDGNESAPPTKSRLPGAWLFVQDSSPFCKATGDPWPLNLFSRRPPGLNPSSYILMSHVLPCLPPDTLPDKDTCMLQLILSFLRVLCGRQDACRPLALSMMRLRILLL